MSSSSCLMCMESSSSRWTTTDWDTHISIPPLRQVNETVSLLKHTQINSVVTVLNFKGKMTK